VGSNDSPEALERLMPNAQTRRVVLNALKPFVPRPRGDVENIQISGRAVPRGTTVSLTKQSHRRIDTAIDLFVAKQVEQHTGDLREIDLDNLTFILRNAEDVREVRCAFEEELLETAKEALDRRVQVTGTRRIQEARRIAASLRFIRLEIIDEDVAEQATPQQGS
jgi:hypothetical protein